MNRGSGSRTSTSSFAGDDTSAFEKKSWPTDAFSIQALREATTSDASIVDPSWNFTSVRSLNRTNVPSSDNETDLANTGLTLFTESSVMSGSKKLRAMSLVAVDVVISGSRVGGCAFQAIVKLLPSPRWASPRPPPMQAESGSVSARTAYRRTRFILHLLVEPLNCRRIQDGPWL